MLAFLRSLREEGLPAGALTMGVGDQTLIPEKQEKRERKEQVLGRAPELPQELWWSLLFN